MVLGLEAGPVAAIDAFVLCRGVDAVRPSLPKLHGRVVQNPPEMWIRRDDAFPPIVQPELFRKAAEAAARSRVLTDEQLLELLKTVTETPWKNFRALDKRRPRYALRPSLYLQIRRNYGGLQTNRIQTLQESGLGGARPSIGTDA
jgi:hypothetical protein